MYKWCILTELALRRQPFLLNLLIQALLSLVTIRTGIQSSRIFFNQTSKQLIFIEQPFGIEPTIGFLCWFRMLLLSLVSFLCLARLQFLSNSLSHNFAHSRVLSICT